MGTISRAGYGVGDRQYLLRHLAHDTHVEQPCVRGDPGEKPRSRLGFTFLKVGISTE